MNQLAFRPIGIAPAMSGTSFPSFNASRDRALESERKRFACEQRVRAEAAGRARNATASKKNGLSLGAQKLLLDKLQAEAERDLLMGAKNSSELTQAQIVIQKHHLEASRRATTRRR